MIDLPRSSGVQLHPTSLPGGRLGREAYAWVDWLADAGQHANADSDLYGEHSTSGGPSGSVCHHVWPACASQSTKA